MSKLFVVVRTDLSPSQTAVQAGHALAEYMLHNDDWKNQTLVYLGVDDEAQLLDVETKLKHKGIPHVGFNEPDYNDALTAIASTEPCTVFKRLNLLQ